MAVMKCLGGEMQARMWTTPRSQVETLEEYGHEDPERKLTLDDLIRHDDLVFAATGITPGETLEGVRYFRGGGADPHAGHVYRAPCDKIYGYHRRPRAKSRAAWLPALTNP